MSGLNERKGFAGFVAGIVFVLVFLYGVWLWGFCRFYVPPGHMAIITSKDGAALPPDQILAKRGQKGIWEEPLAEGRHFLNPIAYDWQIVPAVHIPAGKVGVVTSKVGKDLAPGEFLADAGQKGIWRRVLGPGTYRFNPTGYSIDVLDAMSIPIGYVGVVTSLSGDKAPDGAFAGDNQKGVRADVLQPGLYYVNPNEFKVDVLEVGLNQVSLIGKEGGQVFTKSQMDVQNVAMQELASNVLAKQQQKRRDYLDQQMAQAAEHVPQARTAQAVGMDKMTLSVGGKAAAPGAPLASKKPMPQEQGVATLGLAQFVEFPSRDGFEIRLDMTVEFELLPVNIAEIYLRYGDLPAVVDKIIMPQILSVSRLKGSTYRAKDFIAGEGREKFQNELKDSLTSVLKEKKITAHNSLIRHVEVPMEILDPIRTAAVAVQQNLTNVARQETARKQAELNTAESMVDQKRQEIMQETDKLVAETGAAQETLVASLRAEIGRDVAVINKETAAIQADITRTLGEAKAKIITLVDGEKAKGFQLKVQAMQDAEAYTWVNFAERLNPELSLQLIHAGQGTLWTDLKNFGLGDLGGARVLSAPAPAVDLRK